MGVPRPAVAGYAAAAAVTLLPPLGLVVLVTTWPHPAAVVPVHWGGDGADGFDSSSSLFRLTLIPSIVTALLAVGMALLLDEGSDRRATALGFAALALFGSAVALQWPVAQLTAADRALHDGVGPPFLLHLGSIALAAIAWAAASAGGRSPAVSSPAP